MKNLKNLGKTLNKNEQKLINGGDLGLSGPECIEPRFIISCDPAQNGYIGSNPACSVGYVCHANLRRCVCAEV